MQEPTVAELIENQREIKRDAQAAERIGDTKRVAELAVQFVNLGVKIAEAQSGKGVPSKVVPIVRTEAAKARIRGDLILTLRRRTPYRFDEAGQVVTGFDERGQLGPLFTDDAVQHWHNKLRGQRLEPRGMPPRPYVSLGVERDRYGYLKRFEVRLSEHNFTNLHEAAEQMRRSTALLSLDRAEIDAVMSTLDVIPPKDMQ